MDAKWKTGLVGYLKARFYANFREGCMVNRALCVYPEEDRLEAITSLLAAGVSTQEIDKMRALIDQSKLSPLANLTYLKLISDEREKIVKTDKMQAYFTSALEGGVKDILAKYLVYNPRGAFISMQGSLGRVEATAMFLDILAKNNDIVAGTPEITDNILRFIASEKKKDGSFGSTRDTAAVM